jgi:hypothetical protein
MLLGNLVSLISIARQKILSPPEMPALIPALREHRPVKVSLGVPVRMPALRVHHSVKMSFGVPVLIPAVRGISR